MAIQSKPTGRPAKPSMTGAPTTSRVKACGTDLWVKESRRGNYLANFFDFLAVDAALPS
jgi:hypothetical protein